MRHPRERKPMRERLAAPWFRLYLMDGGREDIPATMAESSGVRLKNRAWELFKRDDVRSVAVLTYKKDKVIYSIRFHQKGDIRGDKSSGSTD